MARKAKTPLQGRLWTKIPCPDEPEILRVHAAIQRRYCGEDRAPKDEEVCCRGSVKCTGCCARTAVEGLQPTPDQGRALAAPVAHKV